jgi:hypothetical protein
LQEKPEEKRWKAIFAACCTIAELEKWRFKCPDEFVALYTERYKDLTKK